ncbi:hypothetical protein [Bdellovibrio sp. HCB209]|uniref:hypothetical protein n=1 Tax=Bdellovibrio sp. HCB209 TaxID=3394354 RepID=UPI0039B43437
MRKIIETTSTLALWMVFIVGSSIAISDFFLNAEVSELNLAHLSLIAWAPFFAAFIFGAMLIAVRFAKNETTKKAIANEHAIQWTAQDLAAAQTGKVVDLHFASTGLDCQVVTRNEVAEILHIDNQTLHVTVLPQKGDEPALALLPKAY